MNPTVHQGAGHYARYNRGAVILHWLIAALIVANLAIGLFHESLPRGAIPIHKSIGFTVLALSALRLLWRLTHRPPRIPRDVPAWQRLAASLSHWTFYLLMFALPVSGWVFVSAAVPRRPLDYFGLFPLPYLPVVQDKSVNAPFHQGHVVMGWIMLGLLALHVVAALKHHFLDRDTVLARMLPLIRPRDPEPELF